LKDSNSHFATHLGSTATRSTHATTRMQAQTRTTKWTERKTKNNRNLLYEHILEHDSKRAGPRLGRIIHSKGHAGLEACDRNSSTETEAATRTHAREDSVN